MNVALLVDALKEGGERMGVENVLRDRRMISYDVLQCYVVKILI